MRSLTVCRAFGACFAAATLLLACADAGCGDRERPLAAQTPQRATPPAFRLVVMTDLDGYLEPCGCQTRPLGGIDKAAGRMRALGADGVPSLFLTAGNLFAAPEDHGTEMFAGIADEDDVAAQARAEAETLAKILDELSLAAAVPGVADAKIGKGNELLDLALRNDIPIVCGTAVCRDVLVERGGVRIGVWGLGGLISLGDESAVASELLADAKKRTQELHARGADFVVGLWAGSVRLGRRVASATEGLSFLVQGGADSPDVLPPERIGHTLVLRAGHRGHGLLVADVFPGGKDFAGGKGPFTDVGPWAKKAQRDALLSRSDELAARIAEWRKDAQVDRAQLAEQESRLRALRAELAALDTAPRPAGNVVSAQFIELGPEVAADPEIGAVLDAHDKRVNEHNREVFADIAPKPVPKGVPGYTGAERCGACHETQFAWWKRHAHGHAYRTLEERNKQFSLSCVGCHVTGYNQPGGAAVVQNAGLTDVGCESCHGPGAMHAQDPDVEEARNVHRDAAESVCLVCHNAEHSDQFAYAKYRASLIVPGHGLPAAKVDAAPKAEVK